MTYSPYIVALTGGIASGKSTVERLFADLGVPIIDADKISREVVEKDSPALKELVDHFGQQILNKEGTLNRAQLRERIFNNPKARIWVNQLLHPIIHQMTQAQIIQVTAPYLIWVVPLLVENDLQHHAHHVLVVESNPAIQLERLKKRDMINETLAKNMLSSQATNEIRRGYADDVIENSGQEEQLRPIVNQLHQKYLELAKNHNTNRAD